MFKESNERMAMILDNNRTTSLNELAAAQREFEGQIKLVNAVVSAFAVMSKNERAKDNFTKLNIIDMDEFKRLVTKDKIT
jgi:alpha-N-acetylglucosamine transferase